MYVFPMYLARHGCPRIDPAAQGSGFSALNVQMRYSRYIGHGPLVECMFQISESVLNTASDFIVASF